MAERQLTQDYVRSLFEYDPETGVLTWKERPREHFNSARGRNIFNARFAGKAAGSTSDGYIQICIDGDLYYAHRLAWVHVHGEWPEHGIDHKNRSRSHNWIDNLRPATQAKNVCNASLSKRNTSGAKGVRPHGKRWVAQIAHNKRRFHLGVFDTKEEASNAYEQAASTLFGEFAAK
jgi:hypothetical protein